MEQNNVYPMNSREWWEEYFLVDWNKQGGSEQTRYFMQRLLSELPVTEAAFLGSRSLTILDWGCAWGEGVELLGQAFPESRVVGLDVALNAIEQARLRHPNREFIRAANGEITGEYDVVVTSNCLEHFEYPLGIIETHLRSCRELYVVLVPYNEFPLSECHRSQFMEESFPERIGGFVRIATRVIDTDPAFWKGQQLLVIYGSQAYLRERINVEKKALEQNKWNEYYAALPLFERDDATQAFGVELVERVLELLPSGSRLLEAGCGGGWQSLALARSGKFQVTLMDFSREALQYARRLFEREHLQAEFIYGDVFTQGEPQFDLVFNAGVLEHYTLKEQAAFLRGMASRSRNYVLALVPNRLCYWYWPWRIQKSSSGQWPFGKEVPLAEFSAAFRSAGLQFLGNTFMGQEWADSFVLDLANTNQELCNRILEVNRSPLIPREQKSYLLAGLGSVSTDASKVPGIWSLSPVHDEMQKAEMLAALADALALRIGAEHKLIQLQAEGSEKEKAQQTLSSTLAKNEQALLELSARIAEKERIVESLSSEIAEKADAISALSDRAAEAERNAQSLASKVAAEAERNAQSLVSKVAAEAERNAQSLAWQLAAKDHELRRITNTMGWRLLSRYGRIKYRYLLPVYKALGLPPYKKRVNTGKATELSPNQSPGIDPATQAAAPEPAWNDKLYKPSQSNAYDVICFPIIDWDFRYQRPQQLMSRFAAAGHRVFYIAQNFHSSGPAYTIQQKHKNIYEISLLGLERIVYADPLDDKARDVLFDSLDTLRRDLSLGATVAFAQLPFWWPLVNKTRARFGWPIVYDCMDHHAGFSTNKLGMIAQERDLLASADLVVASSGFLEDRGREHNSNILLVRNACDYEHFAKADKAKNGRPVVGYYGAIAEWFDSSLVADLATKRPDWDFVLVGSTYNADISRLSQIDNVSLPGEKPYLEIPDWLSKFDVAIIPFKRNSLTEATNPVKVYEILAAGKPVVSVPIPEVAALDGLLHLASTADEFENKIAAALLETGPGLPAKRRAFAREHTWEKRFDVLAPAVRNVFPKASIIVVTFNNLELNRLCLESIYACTEWPNFEVIVVDNASADGTPGYLREAEEVFPNLRVVLNNSNLGFAAANNIGLKLATGDYLVLLNNDTVVTRGWVSALIRHLHADPSIGMIGPVTNAISNEAKIDVGYDRLEGMPDWAADYVREHDGQIFSISMLAMFCVAMRREVFEKVGYLDERFGVGMFEDDDYCRRLRGSGYEIRCARDSFIHHWQRASFRLIGEEEYLKIYQENRKKYERKWKDRQSIRGSKGGAYREGLQHVLEKVKNSKGAVVFLPSIGWNIHLFQRPHHLAREFARQGYVSIFDSSNSGQNVKGFREIESNLVLFNGSVDLLHEIPDSVLWAFPYNFDQTDAYPNTVRTVYDWIDDLDVFPYDRAFLERNHRRALKEASAVVSVARRLHERAVAVRSDAIYLPNGVEWEVFAADDATVPDDVAALVREGKPIAGYYGALAEWFDYKLLDEVAGLRTDWNFLLIGQALDQSLSRQSILNRGNVKWIGPRQYASLPGYLRTFDVATIPFVINNITLATSPLKLYEYFAGGKPVITTAMPECESFSEVSIVRSALEFSQQLDRAREQGQDEKYRQRVRSLARQNSWTVRVQTVERLLQRNDKPEPDAQSTQPHLTVTSRSTAQSQRALSQPPKLIGAAADLAERFRDFSTINNQRFFNALCNHLSPQQSDPCLSMYFEFAITCNERGRRVARLLRKYTRLRSRHYLDLGCAYSGFLVAFAEQGAEVTGIDTNQTLLDLGQHNLADNNLEATLINGDATRSDLEFGTSFDIITCNDVIEHVDDPQSLLRNIADLLRDDGIAYFEIPNRYNPRHVLQDGHYNLFGITLLDYTEANQYYSLHAPGVPYGVRHYLGIDEYTRMFEGAGLTFTLMEENFEGVDVQTVLNDIARLRSSAKTAMHTVPPDLRPRVEERLSGYLNELGDPISSGVSQRDFIVRYGLGFWRVLGRKGRTRADAVTGADRSPAARRSESRSKVSFSDQNNSTSAFSAQTRTQRRKPDALFEGMASHPGKCNICGNETQFFYTIEALYRESLVCGNCLTTSRYRSIARGLLRGIKEISGIEGESIAELDPSSEHVSLKIYDTQVPFRFETCAYPIPDLLNRFKWIELQTSTYRPKQRLGAELGPHTTNQNLEALTYLDNSFDIVVTSDVMEHVRLDDRAHREIRRVLKPGGIYLFTVPHFRDRYQTFRRVAVIDPGDPRKDEFLTEKEYHGDANSKDGRALSYRSYGTDLDDILRALGFSVDYCKTDFPQMGIMNTELFFCRLSK